MATVYDGEYTKVLVDWAHPEATVLYHRLDEPDEWRNSMFQTASIPSGWYPADFIEAFLEDQCG